VLQFRTLQALGLVDPETPVLGAPALEDLLGRACPAGGLSDCAALGYRRLSLSKLLDYLLRRSSSPGHISPFLRPNTNILSGPVLGGRSVWTFGIPKTTLKNTSSLAYQSF